MDKYTVIKNGLVLTLDENGNTGYYNIVIKNDKIFYIDFENELNRDSVILSKFQNVSIIDATDKLIIPAFINANLNSSYSQNTVLLRGCNYTEFKENLSLILIDKYFKNPEFRKDLKNLISLNFFRALFNGETFIQESSKYIDKEFFLEYGKYNFLSYIDNMFISYDNNLSSYFYETGKPHTIGLISEDDINNYTLSSLKKFISTDKSKVFIEVMQSIASLDKVKSQFGKSIIKVFSDNDLLSSELIMSNPAYIQAEDIDFLQKNKVNIVICPSDLFKLSEKSIIAEEFFKRGFNISIGTGYLGNDVLSELKIFLSLMNKNNINYEQALKMLTFNYAQAIGMASIYGSIVKNKYANLLFFNLKDVRNFLNVPEITSERISEFIIEYLTAKDISDVIAKGNVLIKNHQCRLFDLEAIKQLNISLSNKIYEVGKYYEFQEKYLMRKRINALSQREEVDKNNLYFSGDNLETEELLIDNPIITDSEFRVIGLQRDVSPYQLNGNTGMDEILPVVELESLESGLRLFDNDSVLKGESKKINSELLNFTSDKEVSKESYGKMSNHEEKENVTQEKKQNLAGKKISFKKEKLRFGFSEESE